MRFLLSTTLAVSLLSTHVWAGASSDLVSPVCIIGGGPTGLSAAHALESQGHQVVVFEKQPEVGGKCQAYYAK